MGAERLPEALTEAGFHEAAALVAADVESQAVEEEADELDGEQALRVHFAGADDYPDAA